jgi:hypothetical protein
MSSDQWTDDEVEGLLKTIFIAVTLAGIGFYFFSPTRFRQQQQQHQNQRQRLPAHQAAPQPILRPSRRPEQALAANHDNDDDEDGINYFLKTISRVPPHHASRSSSSRVSYDGVIPFRFTKAATYEAKIVSSNSNLSDGTDDILQNRKGRALILAKLFKKLDPPARGNMLVFSIPSSQISSDNGKLQRILFLLGTYYNVFVMVNCDDDVVAVAVANEGNNELTYNAYTDDKKRCNALIAKLYESDILTEEVLPSHRIVVTNSVASRVAFVRSFPKSPNYIIGVESERELQILLTKFGYKVILKNIDALIS